MFIATLVASERLAAGDISAACDAVSGNAGSVVDGVAVDVAFNGDPVRARQLLEQFDGVDAIVQPLADRRRRLLVADMDSTMITVECIDELADYAGVRDEVATVTERAMRGELDFAAALAARVALLAGLAEDTLQACLRERVRPTPGARELIEAFNRAGGETVLVSGGFTHFAEPVARMLGFARVVANRLELHAGRLTGRVLPPVVTATTKRAVLMQRLAGLGLLSVSSVAIGDGANDIPMIEAAGLGIAYHAKPSTVAAADASVRYGDLGVVRHALGLPRPE